MTFCLNESSRSTRQQKILSYLEMGRWFDRLYLYTCHCQIENQYHPKNAEEEKKALVRPKRERRQGKLFKPWGRLIEGLGHYLTKIKRAREGLGRKTRVSRGLRYHQCPRGGLMHRIIRWQCQEDRHLLFLEHLEQLSNLVQGMGNFLFA